MFNWFKKKETLIESNPPARQATILARKKQLLQEIDAEYARFINYINNNINNGSFRAIVQLQDDYYDHYASKKPTKRQVIMYIAARKLRNKGFKVKIRRLANRGNHMSLHYSNTFTEHVYYTRQIEISWNHE